MCILLERFFTLSPDGVELSYDHDINWVQRTAEIKGPDGEVLFKQENIRCPEAWSQLSLDIASSKYFYGAPGTLERECDIEQLCKRVAGTISKWALEDKYIDSEEAKVFYDELMYVLLHQVAAFNSPVWFNCGVGEKAQLSACFLLSVQDSLESILELQRTQAMIYKFGSGSGVNLSTLRSSKEPIGSGDNTSSGPVSFMRGFDSWAGVIKSGQRKRRAAQMFILDDSHPDILEFIDCKVREENKARALAEVGYEGSVEVSHVFYQNANHSVRVTDNFMNAAAKGQDWVTKYVVTGEPCETLKARDVLHKIAESTWCCGDPGIQFHDTTNLWHTCKNSGEIVGGNPCCFTGDMLIDTSEGRIRIDELVRMYNTGEELPYAFSYDFNLRDPALCKIKRAWVAGKATKIVTVTTEKGHSIRCTPEHKFYLYDGTAVEAKNLKTGVHLRKIARAANKHRSNRRMLYCREGKGEFQNRWTWEQVNGSIPEGFHVHHRNGDPTDDRLSNLALEPGKDHISEHSLGESNPRFINIPDDTLMLIMCYLESKPKGTHKQSTKFTSQRWNDAINSLGLCGVVPKANHVRGIQGKPWVEFMAWAQQRVSEVNDRVVSVEIVDSDELVYDIEVEGIHNFGVTNLEDTSTSSLVVSNSEYVFLPDSACNLASINLLKFLGDDGVFDHTSFCRVARILVIAMDVVVGKAGYPTPQIADNSLKFRALGLGYTNLGALLMASGLPYDSDSGRELAAAITALLTGEAYRTSGLLAEKLGTFPGFATNKKPMLEVIQKHKDCVESLSSKLVPNGLVDKTNQLWDEVVSLGKKVGFRNAQVTLLAPNGTIGFLMGCSTTGVEPAFSLVSYKRLVGGGALVLTAGAIVRALETLGYSEDKRMRIKKYIEDKGTVEGCLDIRDIDIPVFDCAAKASSATRVILPGGHISMMAAVQPFLSGAISKTINVPNDTSVEQIEDLYIKSWQAGLKSVAIYRDGSKGAQPLSTSKKDDKEVKKPVVSPRRKLPATRRSITHKFEVGGSEGYLTVGLYEDGMPGELFVTMSKSGSPFRGLLDAIGILVSKLLQYRAGVQVVCDMLRHMRFEPAGMTSNPDIRFASSILDYIAKWLELQFLKPTADEPKVISTTEDFGSDDSPLCSECGMQTRRSGTCFVCLGCGSTSGCS